MLLIKLIQLNIARLPIRHLSVRQAICSCYVGCRQPPFTISRWRPIVRACFPSTVCEISHNERHDLAVLERSITALRLRRAHWVEG